VVGSEDALLVGKQSCVCGDRFVYLAAFAEKVREVVTHSEGVGVVGSEDALLVGQ